jgi:hypothetical protein
MLDLEIFCGKALKTCNLAILPVKALETFNLEILLAKALKKCNCVFLSKGVENTGLCHFAARGIGLCAAVLPPAFRACLAWPSVECRVGGGGLGGQPPVCGRAPCLARRLKAHTRHCRGLSPGQAGGGRPPVCGGIPSVPPSLLGYLKRVTVTPAVYPRSLAYTFRAVVFNAFRHDHGVMLCFQRLQS